ncbi:hypothetical protein OV450_4355 [Actinobacteria bacterium OV450]|nr:hypothetical protein OV450_4355 [Actinobacteria bacterium OV450]
MYGHSHSLMAATRTVAPSRAASLSYLTATARFLLSRFLTVAEVAETMRFSKLTVYRLLHNGHHP